MIHRTQKRFWLCVILLAVNLLFIWGNSLLPGSASGALSHWIKAIIERIFSMTPSGEQGHGLLRKLAHFTEFASLGVLLSVLIRMYRSRSWEHFGLPLALGALAACIDETIQYFVPGRGPGLRDVGIDVLGVILGIIFLWMVYFFRKVLKIPLEE